MAQSDTYNQIRSSVYPWLTGNAELMKELDKLSISSIDDKKQGCALVGVPITQRVCVENKLKTRECPIRLQRRCSMYAEHKQLMDGIIQVHRAFNKDESEPIKTTAKEEDMSNRNKKESIAFFVKERVTSGVAKETIVTELAAKLTDGTFKSKQPAQALVTWYTNHFTKQTATPSQTNVATE